MRALFFILGFWTLAGISLAQTQPPPLPPQAPAADPNAKLLDDILYGWEKSMAGADNIEVKCAKTVLDKTFQSSEVMEGSAKFMKGKPSRGSLELVKKGRPDIFEKFLYTGNFLYSWSLSDKVIRRLEIPQAANGQLGEDNLVSLLFGMKADDAKKRYHFQYVQPPQGDQWYHYLRIFPRTSADAQDFMEARLVLLRSSFMPRQVWFLKPNKHEETWDFPQIQNPARLTVSDFGTPQLPPGWRFENIQPQAKALPVKVRN